MPVERINPPRLNTKYRIHTWYETRVEQKRNRRVLHTLFVFLNQPWHIPHVIKQSKTEALLLYQRTVCTHSRRFSMSVPYRTLPRLPLLVLLVVCVLATFLSLQEVVATASVPTRNADGRTVSHTTTSPACVPLQGIESNTTGSLSPDEFLDLDVIRVSLKDEIFNVTNPVLQKFGECSAGLETPIATRILLGGSRQLLPTVV